jgi:hypothetical protein
MFATHLGRQTTDVSADKTLAAADIGVVQNLTASGKVITLPATVVGYVFIVRVGGSGSTDHGITVNVSPNAADKIAGLGFTATDDKDAICTLGAPGAEIALIGDGVNGWMVLWATGTWTREA